ncbi:MAG: double-strand break repair protein AddB [Alphaproteobacteria bacterium]|nr:double-strand break repair protein AddB [Alphaproteobacteria bacterium]
MSGSPPGLYTIPPGRPFLRDLAEGVVERFHVAGDPLSLAAVTIFLPTRRAERTLREEIVRAAGVDALVMPSIRVLGDVDEDAALFVEAEEEALLPEIPRLERDLVLARMVHAYRLRTEGSGGFAVSLALAQSLARLIDEAANEDANLSGIATVAHPDMAEHWAKSVAFLDIAVQAWPAYLAEKARLDPAARRALAIRSYARSLAEARPAAPFIAAGSSGSIRATADLLKVIAGLPNGAVVLDGLDTGLDHDTWEAVATAPSHPQFALRELLIHLAADRLAVGRWIGSPDTAAARRRFLSEAMRPPEAPPAASLGRAEIQAGLDGVALIEAANEREEALAIALAIRETLEKPEATVALVTPDRMLARRVSAELRRWDIAADDSAGLPLAKTEAGALLTMVLEAALGGGTPVALLSVLKHPCVALGGDRYDLLSMVRRFERRVLRGGRITGGFDDIRRAMAARDAKGESELGMTPEDAAELPLLVDRIAAALAPLTALGGAHDMAELVAAHAAALENLSADAKGRARVWQGDDGAAAFALFETLGEAAAAADQVLTLADYAHSFDRAVRAMPVRPQGPRHPRVSIWGPLEARLHFADLMVLGGMNEGVWPANPADDPWLSRPMRKTLGLSEPERRIGLSAHDFTTFAAQPRVLLTRARRQDGAPANPSRFLLRMTALAGEKLPEPQTLDWARRLDAADVVTPARRPMPAPPVAARPRKLSVTTIERWLRDPYEIYARHVLKLKVLDRLEPELEARHRGDMVHRAAELLARMPAADSSGDIYTDLIACGRTAFGAALGHPDVKSFWWPRFERAARWFSGIEAGWRADRVASVIEERREWPVEGLDFVLTGQPDRIDLLANGGLRVIDYKTGSPPTNAQAAAFLAPQLPLLALLARDGAFGPDMQAPADTLVYVQLSGARREGRLVQIADPAILVEGIEQKLRDLIRTYDDPGRAYPSRVAVLSTRYEGDYDHLARMLEWTEALEDEF